MLEHRAEQRVILDEPAPGLLGRPRLLFFSSGCAEGLFRGTADGPRENVRPVRLSGPRERHVHGRAVGRLPLGGGAVAAPDSEEFLLVVGHSRRQPQKPFRRRSDPHALEELIDHAVTSDVPENPALRLFHVAEGEMKQPVGEAIRPLVNGARKIVGIGEDLTRRTDRREHRRDLRLVAQNLQAAPAGQAAPSARVSAAPPKHAQCARWRSSASCRRGAFFVEPCDVGCRIPGLIVSSERTQG